jgi:hypothetical protein
VTKFGGHKSFTYLRKCDAILGMATINNIGIHA